MFNQISSMAILIIVILGYLYNVTWYIDIAIIYAGLSFIGAMAFLKYVSSNDQ